MFSRSYDTEAIAMMEVELELACGEENNPAGPYTAVVFKTPTSVTLKGKMFTQIQGQTVRLIWTRGNVLS